MKVEDILVFDLETTGLNTRSDYIIEFGGLLGSSEASSLIVNDGIVVSQEITKITNITQHMINQYGVDWREYAHEVILPMLEASKIYAGHNIRCFDIPMLSSNLKRVGIKMPERPIIDTLDISRRYLSGMTNNRLATVCSKYLISLDNAHRAFDDARANRDALHKIIDDIFDGSIEELLEESPRRLGKYKVGQDPMTALIL